MALYHHDNDSDHLIIKITHRAPEARMDFFRANVATGFCLNATWLYLIQYLSWLIRGEREKIGIGINLAG